MADVWVVGSLNVDLVVRAPRLPQPGETLIGDGFASHPGGKGANQAVAAARMGVTVAMLGRVGDDEHGRLLLAALQREGVHCGAVGLDARLPTGVAAIVVARDGENSIVVVPGANQGLTSPHVAQAAEHIVTARVVVAQLETPQDTVFDALDRARRAGAITLLNAAPAAALSARQLESVQWLVVNEGEAGLLLGKPVDDVAQARTAALALRALGPPDVVLTLGANGLVHACADGVMHHPTAAVTAVDSTGAGDTFVGVLAAALAQGWPAAEALRWGQAAASIAVTRRGAQAAMPTRAEVALRLARRDAA